MNHPDNDAILKYALETLEPDERGDIRNHLDSCPECRHSLDEISRDIALISGLPPGPGGRVLRMPVRRWIGSVPVFRAAAILIAGFLAGYYASEFTRATPVTVVQQRLEPVPASWGDNRFTVCDVIDIASN